MDNFELIALNMVLIRQALEERHADRFPDDKSLFIACGVMDTILHLREGHFTVRDVADAMLYANLGKCHLGLTTSVPVEDETECFYCGPTDLFLNYTLQIEAMVFNAIEQHVDASGMSEQDIVMTVLGEKERIRRILDTPKEELAHSQQMAGVRKLADSFMVAQEFSDYRKAIGLEGGAIGQTYNV